MIQDFLQFLLLAGFIVAIGFITYRMGIREGLQTCSTQITQLGSEAGFDANEVYDLIDQVCYGIE